MKPLSKAIEDGNHVYAVVLSSAFEHSGRSNGYSAPNPNAQADLIAHALRKGSIHPESIGYIEGHGTGTLLGDSLEIAALTKAFRQSTDKRQFCPVGSVKANIGHGESAAGIAGITKVILQMKHRQLVPTVYCEQPNPDIDFASSPFYLQREAAPWNPPGDRARRALINSFGAGGVNACIVLEEFKAASPVVGAHGHEHDAHLFVLSARSESGLREYAARLLTHLSKNQEVDLAGLAYTLQAGRDSMVERLAVVAGSTMDLSNQLRGWLDGDPSVRVHRATVAKAGGRGSAQDDKALAGFLAARDLDKVAERWCAGERIDWQKLYRGSPPVTVPLPTYPFARDRHWLSAVGDRQKTATVGRSEARLHPLVSGNSSTLQAVRLDSLLSPDEFYSKDHQVNGERIFPGAGFLEIACIAGHVASERKVARIEDVAWIQPLDFRRGSRLVQTSLRTIGDSIEYDITSSDAGNERVVHSEGRLRFREGPAASPGNATRVSIQELRQHHPERQDGDYYYELFRRLGLDYGPCFQSKIGRAHV